MELGLKGKNILVTGGTRGIGKAIALGFAKEAGDKNGSQVAVCGRDHEQLNVTRNAIRLLSTNALSIKCDVLKDDVTKVIDEVKNKWGKIDIIICNVGGGGAWKVEDYKEVMKKNYFANVDMVNYYLPEMVKNGWGRIVFISSIYGKEKGPNPGFAAAKAAEIAYVKSMAGKYEGVTFNAICPGHIAVGKPFPDEPKIIGKPEDVANLVLFLCSDLAKHITGAVITVDGGVSSSF